MDPSSGMSFVSWIIAPFSPDSDPIPDRSIVCSGPNDENYDPGAPLDVGELMQASNSASPNNSKTYNGADAFEALVKVEWKTAQKTQELEGVPIRVLRPDKKPVDQGETDSNGKLNCLGLRVDDTFKATFSGMTRGLTIENEENEYKILFEARNSAKVPGLLAKLIKGAQQEMLARQSNGLTFELYTKDVLAAPPLVKVFLDKCLDSTIVTMSQIDSSNFYQGMFNAESCAVGMIEVIAANTQGDTNSSLIGFTIDGISPSEESYIRKSNITCEVYLPSGAVTSSDTLLITDSRLWTHFDKPLQTLLEHSYSLELTSADTIFAQPAQLKISYSEGDVKDRSESSIKCYRWGQSESVWEEISSTADTIENTVRASINRLGTYALFIESYRGDPNGDRRITLSDIIYLVNYIFKGGTEPAPLAAGDVNCDLQVTLADVIYLVNYIFKHGDQPCDL